MRVNADEFAQVADDIEITKEKVKQAFVDKLSTVCGKTLDNAAEMDRYLAVAQVVRDIIAIKWQQASWHSPSNEKQVYYFSIEFLIGRLLKSYLSNLGLQDVFAAAMHELGLDIDRLAEQEEDPGLGNGGLGRLAACYLDSMAALGLPGNGVGIRYRYGLFEQKIVDGRQVEMPDNWLQNSYPWEFRRDREAVPVWYGGHVRMKSNGRLEFIQEDYQTVLAVPYDVPIIGYRNNTANVLRLWSAEVPDPSRFLSAIANDNYAAAFDYRSQAESISDTLYPDDSTWEGRLLRLKQQYFLVSAGLQWILKRHRRRGGFGRLAQDVAIHINDTHPALAIPELMRLLIDREGLGWDEAWAITTGVMSYTNHTVLPEALEKWPVDMFRGLLPRIYMIVEEINERFCRQLWDRYPGDWQRIGSMAVIADGQVHMAHLAIAGSHSVNGVARSHYEILRKETMRQFFSCMPERFSYKTNGVTHRRWLKEANPRLADLVTEVAGPDWIDYPCNMLRLLDHADDPGFLSRVAEIKQANKRRVARHLKDKYGLIVDPAAIFDVHIKRIHAYKRQVLNMFHIMHLWRRLKEDPSLPVYPRVFIFAGKAAFGYGYAKQVIKLINTFAGMVNNDPKLKDKLKVVFLENYNVSYAELLMPAADVSEQIPTASREACGTGNMKLMMNGAVTIGTADGGNIEIMNMVGPENIYIFGLSGEQIIEFYEHGGYNPREVYEKDPRLKWVVNALIDGTLPGGPDEFRLIYDDLMVHNDYFFVLKDFAAYVDAQIRLGEDYLNARKWQTMMLHNIAHSGQFSSDRTFSEYAMDTWNLRPTAPVRCYCKSEAVFPGAGACVAPQGGLQAGAAPGL